MDDTKAYRLGRLRGHNDALDEVVDKLHSIESHEMFSNPNAWNYDDVYRAIASLRKDTVND